MGTLHPEAEALQRAELQLFDGPFGLVQASRNLADTPLLDKALDDHAMLISRELVDEMKQIDAAVGRVCLRLDARLKRARSEGHLSRGARALESVREGMGGDAKEPRGKGRPQKLQGRQGGQGLVKHFGRYVFSGGAITHPAGHIAVDALEVLLVQLAEPRRVLLRRFDLEALVGVHEVR